MTTTSSLAPAGRTARVDINRVLLAGVTVGVLDALAAVLLYVGVRHVPTERLFQGIASALLGKAAFTGGTATALLGLAMHFGVALAWAAVYALLYARWPLLSRMTRTTRGALAVGAAYGVVVHLLMTFVVVPLTRIGPPRIVAPVFFVVLVIHMLVVGPPIALLIRERQ
jgi:hypothetical protein